jgi:hypothetical protein
MAAQAPTVSNGRILFVHEIVARGATANNLSVKVTGYLSGVDHAQCRAELLDPRIAGCGISVDTRQLVDQYLRDDELVQIIGELSTSSGAAGGLLLSARTLRTVDGLPFEKFEKALQFKRAFEAELAL